MGKLIVQCEVIYKIIGLFKSCSYRQSGTFALPISCVFKQTVKCLMWLFQLHSNQFCQKLLVLPIIDVTKSNLV